MHDSPSGQPAPATDTLTLYKALCDLWAEANAVDTVIGRPDALMAKLTALRDTVGGMTGAYLAAAPAATQAQAEPKDHQVRDLVNALRDVAIKFHDTQQLRSRLAGIVLPWVQQHCGWIGPSAPVGDGAAQPAGEEAHKLRIVIDLLRDTLGPLEVSAAVIESDDTEPMEQLIERVKWTLNQYDTERAAAARAAQAGGGNHA